MAATRVPGYHALLRLWPLAAIAALLAIAYAFGLHRYVSFDALGQQQQRLQTLVRAHPVGVALGYVALYAVMVGISLPGSTVMTLAGGMLFGTGVGAACAVVGATCGAVLLFLAARYAIGGWLAARAGPFMTRVQAGLAKDGFSYLLALRLIPVVPFWLVNLAPALARMRLLPFAAATFLGIIPATTVFASIGAGIGTVIAEGRQPDLAVALRPAVLLPLAGLAALALLPVAWRRWKARHAAV